jgi:hypothetical protein
LGQLQWTKCRKENRASIQQVPADRQTSAAP